MPIVGANLYEIGYCLIGADIFSKNIVKYPPFFPRDEEASNKLVASQPSSGQGESLGSWSKLTSLDNMDVILSPGKAEVGKEMTVLYRGRYEYKYKEYKCKVVEVKQCEVKVQVRWSAEWIGEIWVRRDTMDVRLLNPGEAEVGKMVTVLYEGKEYKCKVVEVKQGKWGRAVKVHYVGYNAGYDEWLSSIWAEALRSPQVL